MTEFINEEQPHQADQLEFIEPEASIVVEPEREERSRLSRLGSALARATAGFAERVDTKARSLPEDYGISRTHEQKLSHGVSSAQRQIQRENLERQKVMATERKQRERRLADNQKLQERNEANRRGMTVRQLRRHKEFVKDLRSRDQRKKGPTYY